MSYRVFPTAFGHAAVAWEGEKITSLRLAAATADEAERAIRRARPGATRAEPPPTIVDAINRITRHFAGEVVDFADVALDLGQQSPFAAAVYAHIRALGRGETTTYGAIARALGAGPESARAVGQAMASNPVPLIIPCHRVLAASGLGGFSAPGGGGTKVRMLALEGVATAPTQQAFAF